MIDTNQCRLIRQIILLSRDIKSDDARRLLLWLFGKAGNLSRSHVLYWRSRDLDAFTNAASGSAHDINSSGSKTRFQEAMSRQELDAFTNAALDAAHDINSSGSKTRFQEVMSKHKIACGMGSLRSVIFQALGQHINHAIAITPQPSIAIYKPEDWKGAVFYKFNPLILAEIQRVEILGGTKVKDRSLQPPGP